jgi:hypothetical protein
MALNLPQLKLPKLPKLPLLGTKPEGILGLDVERPTAMTSPSIFGLKEREVLETGLPTLPKLPTISAIPKAPIEPYKPIEPYREILRAAPPEVPEKDTLFKKAARFLLPASLELKFKLRKPTTTEEIWERGKDIEEYYGRGEDLIGGITTFGRGLTKLPKATAVAILQATQGHEGASVVDKDWADRYIEDAQRDLNLFAYETSQKYKEKKLISGLPLKITDLAEFPQNLAFSITSMGVGLGTGVPIAAIPLPGARVAAWTLGTAASGKVAYEMTTYQIMQSYLELKDEEKKQKTGQGITAEEEKQLKEQFNYEAMKYGLWEALPEAISNLGFVAILTAPLTKIVGNSMAKTILTKLTGMYGEELLTETITQKGQSDIEVEAGLREGKITWMEAFKEIAPQTFLLTTIMAGAGSVVVNTSKVVDSLKNEIGKVHPLFEQLKSHIEETITEIQTRPEAGFVKVPGVPEKKPTIPKELEPLETWLQAEVKAGRIKSAEEFISTQRKAFHGSPIKDLEKIGFGEGVRSNTFLGGTTRVKSGAIFFTPDEKVAKFFADNRVEWLKDLGKTGEPIVYERYLNIKNPLDLTGKNIREASKILDKAGIDLEKEILGIEGFGRDLETLLVDKEIELSNLWKIVDKPELVNKLKKLGIDGAIFEETGKRGISYAIFNPDQAFTKQQLTNLYTQATKGIKEVKPEVKPKSLDRIITEEATQLKEMEIGLRGGMKIGAEGLEVRATEHSPAYSAFYKEHGTGPRTLANWKKIAEKELEAGRSVTGQIEAFRATKEAEKEVVEEINVEEIFKEVEERTMVGVPTERQIRGALITGEEKTEFLKTLSEDIRARIEKGRGLTPTEAGRVGKIYEDFIKTSGFKERLITMPESRLLKMRLGAEVRGAKVGIIHFKREQRFLEALEKEIKTAMRVPLGKERSRIAFIKKLAEFPQTVMSEIKAEIGLDKPLKEANLEQLSTIVGKLKERYRFKLERGYEPSMETLEKLRIKPKEAKSMEMPESVYLENREISAEKKPRLKEKVKELAEGTAKMVDILLAPISTRLANIDISLKYALRKMEFGIFRNTQKDFQAVKPYLIKLNKMPENDFYDLDLALKNGDIKKINEINKQYNLEREYESVANILDDLYKRADEVGFDIGYRKNYWPRRIKDVDGFLEYFGKQEWWSVIDEAIKRKEMDLGRYLINEEKAYLINNMIRGYRGGQITLSKTGAMKERVVDYVSPELNQFYHDSITSLSRYIGDINDAIEARKFFGKRRIGEAKTEQFNNLEDSIGAYVTNLLARKAIAPAQELVLRDILNARFNPKGTHGIVGLYKNLSYIDVMGSPYNAITQLGDLAWSFYRTDIIRTLKEAGKSTIGISKIKKEDIGIERIAQEFSKEGLAGRMVDRVFKIVGLDKIDRIGKESLINGAIQKYQKLAQKPTPKFLKQMRDIFGEETDALMLDLKNKEITENVKYLAFNELLDFQPVALSEMPEQYLKGGNGRIFYMLKTYTLKMFDVYRREAFQKMKSGQFIEGVRNLMWLSVLLIATNGAADEIKDLMLGRKTSLKDRIIDQLMTLLGFSRYSLTQIQRDGVGSAISEQIVPPTKSLDNISKDLRALVKDFDESADINKLKTVESIPILGKLYYWWFGKGVETKKKKGEAGIGLPELPKLPALPKLPSLPKLPAF